MQIPSHCIQKGHYQINKPTIDGGDDGLRNKYSYINSENISELCFFFYLRMFRWLHSCCWTMLQTPFPSRVSSEVESVNSALCNTGTVLGRTTALRAFPYSHGMISTHSCVQRGRKLSECLRIPISHSAL